MHWDIVDLFSFPSVPTWSPQLWVSTNLGAHWTKLEGNITNYSWRILNSTLENNTTLYYERMINSKLEPVFLKGGIAWVETLFPCRHPLPAVCLPVSLLHLKLV